LWQVRRTRNSAYTYAPVRRENIWLASRIIDGKVQPISMNKGLLTIIIFDVFVFLIIILAGINGFKKGGMRAFLGFLWIYISFILSAILYMRIAVFLQVTFETTSPSAKIIGFVPIFILVFAITRVFNFLLTRLLKTYLLNSVFGSSIGAIFGAMEAILLISIIFMNMAFYPVHPPLSDSISFKIFNDLPYQVRNYSLWFLPDSMINDSPVYEQKKERDIIEEYGISSGH